MFIHLLLILTYCNWHRIETSEPVTKTLSQVIISCKPNLTQSCLWELSANVHKMYCFVTLFISVIEYWVLTAAFNSSEGKKFLSCTESYPLDSWAGITWTHTWNLWLYDYDSKHGTLCSAKTPTYDFTARCTLVQSAVLRSHVVCLSVRLSVTLVDCDHIGWNSSKLISPFVSLGCSLFATPTWRVCSKGNTHKFGPKVTHPLLVWASETFDRKLRPNGYR